MTYPFSLKKHRILVSAGSTWIPIDSVRVITNIFKGKIGYTIAKLAAELGADVTLLLGPSFDISMIKPVSNLHIIRFKYFEELSTLIQDQVTNGKFDSVVHSAAVSDFKFDKAYVGKLKSNVNELILKLVPTEKIVDRIKILDPRVFLVKFKLEVGISTNKLVDTAFDSMIKSKADLIVASIYDRKFSNHEAFIVDRQKNVTKITGRENIALGILKHIYDRK